jgi:hypothetical protein
MLGSRVAGDRIDVIECQHGAASERAQRARKIRTRSSGWIARAAQRKVLRAAAVRVRRRTCRDQQVGLAAAGGTGDKYPRRGRRLRGVPQQAQRDGVLAAHVGIETLLRRPAQLERQLRLMRRRVLRHSRRERELRVGCDRDLAGRALPGTTISGSSPERYSALSR